MPDVRFARFLKSAAAAVDTFGVVPRRAKRSNPTDANPDPPAPPPPPAGHVTLVRDAEHLERVIFGGVLAARVSIDIMTANFKMVTLPRRDAAGRLRGRGRGESIVHPLARLARKGVDVRILFADRLSDYAKAELRRADPPANFEIRACPRLHSKAFVIDNESMYLGSANLTGAGIGAKSDCKRNFETGIWTEDADLIDPVMDQFNALWEGDACTGCGRRSLCPQPLIELRPPRRKSA